MGIWGRISRRFMGREGEEVGSGEEQSPYELGHRISGRQEEKPPKPEEKPVVPTPKAQAPGPWQIGDVIRPDEGLTYEVREIKGGGMGQVYICIWEEDRTPVVLKTFQRKYLEGKAAIERFRGRPRSGCGWAGA